MIETQKKTAAKVMVEALENEGVKYIFGVPGEENEDFLFALEDSSILFVPVRHEQGAAFIADVWGRLTGEPGVCLSTLGPGATNLMTGVADAFLDRSPLVALTAQGQETRLHRESHQIIDIKKMMEPICKWNASIREPETIPEIIRKAFKVATTTKMGPTHVELVEDIAAECMTDILPLSKTKNELPHPNPNSLKEAVHLLMEAERPLILAGNGVLRNKASKALTEFSKSTHIPVANTFMGKGAISAVEPLNVGTIGLGFKDYIQEAFERADCVLCIGYDLVEYPAASWNTGKNRKIIHIDTMPAEVSEAYIPSIEIVGDLSAALISLTKMIGKKYAGFTSDIRARMLASIESYRPKEDGKFHVPGVLHEVRDALPDHGLVISDVGTHKMWIARNYPAYAPNSCIISNGFATMGISIPGGIAAHLVDPDRPIVCMMGDGGAMMNIQELETAKRLGIGCTYIIFNDFNYGLIEWKQRRNQDKSFGTELTNPDFVELAKSFDIEGFKPSSIEELRLTLDTCLKERKLAVIEIPITTEVNQQLTDELKDYWNNK